MIVQHGAAWSTGKLKQLRRPDLPLMKRNAGSARLELQAPPRPLEPTYVPSVIRAFMLGLDSSAASAYIINVGHDLWPMDLYLMALQKLTDFQR